MICVLDTETTGLPNASWARVVELAAIAVDPDGYVERAHFHSLVCPDVLDERANRALGYNGISVEDLREAPVESAVRASFYAWCANNRITEVWAYNRIFDETFLNRAGFILPWQGCVMRLARHQMPHRQKDPPLRDAAAFFLGVAPTETHRALADARTAAQVLGVLRRL